MKFPGRSFRLAALVAAALSFAAVAAAAPPQRPPATAFLGMPATSNLATNGEWKLVESFPNLTFRNPVFMTPEPGADRIWIAEQAGRLLSFDDAPDTDEVRVVLDLSDVNLGSGDSGLLSMAFHPAYADDDSPSAGLIFVAYAHFPPEEDAALHFRVSRFEVDRDTGVADPESELILIDQLDQHVWHQGGAILFHPGDGFLYITLGDEGGGRCQYGNCQRIDRDLFAGVLRIDVDSIGGDTSHAPPRQPQTGTTANYFVPSDNPFVGDADALEEFYAIGLRSPHRMTHDPVDDLIWIGDVGQSQREEIDVLAAGANFQWNVMEGSIPFDEESEVPDPVVGVWTPPLLDYGRTSGGTVIGGYVYRGSALPQLKGRYIYGDFLSGRLWALRYEKDGDQVHFLGNDELMRSDFRGRTSGITSFGLDRDGEIHVLMLGNEARIHKLVPADKDPGNMPLTLSATGLFQDLASLTAVESLVPYDVLVPLWSDGAAKRRWMSIPTPDVIGYSPTRAWTFPAGSVFVKHFEIRMQADDPGSLRRLETRVLVVQEDGSVYGVTYKWREDGSDADLLTTTEFEDLNVEDEAGEERLLRYQYPGPVDCLACHDPGAGLVLGPRARQFHGVAGPNVDDQLAWLAEAGFLDVGTEGLEPGDIPAFAPLANEAASLELRSRSYLDVNCSHCHGGQQIDRSQWDARLTTPLNRQGIVLGALLGDYGGDGNHVVTPGDTATSVLFDRVTTSVRELRMPPLARSVTDEDFASVLEQWIEGMPATTLAPLTCGDSMEPYDKIGVSDALGVLRAAVSLVSCQLCICDVNDDGKVATTDALRVLRHAVALPQSLTCPPC
ncbi:MAG: PQQ-dependent sugar dehydrogenase [Candidatus Binatia bacterium]